MSFSDPTRGFLGVVVVDVTEEQAAHTISVLARTFPLASQGAAWIAAALQATHRTGANPGGEVAVADVTDLLIPEQLGQIPRDQLLTRPILERLQLI